MTSGFKSFRFILLAGLLPLLATNCATVLRGTRDQVGIASQPAGAEVIVDNKFLGKTPVTAELRSGAAKAELTDGTLYVILTHEPDPTWVKVGQMQRSLPVD